MSSNLFKKRVYGVVIVKSKLANYNADFTGAPRTLPDGTVYATDKVLKFKIRDYLEKSGKEEIFVKTKYKENGNPMTLEEVYKYHFKEDAKDKIITLKNLLSMLDVRLFGVTFAKKGDNNLNLSIHGPVQISYGVNRFTEMKDSGMFTDQIGSQFASDPKDSQTTLGAQTRSFEAHYVHHFSINPKNLEHFVRQVLIERIVNKMTIIKKDSKENVLDRDNIKDKVSILEDSLKTEVINKLEENNINIEEWQSFVKEKVKDNFELFLKFLGINEDNFILLSENDVNNLKKAMQIAVTAYDSTSKKDAENEFLMWIELGKENPKSNKTSNCSETVLKNFSELIEVTKENEKTKINLEKVFKYLQNFKNCIKKIEIYYDDNFSEVNGISNNEWKENGNNQKEKIEVVTTLGKINSQEEDTEGGND